MTDFSFHLYILKCSDGSYYTGIAGNIERRLTEHSQGTACSYTAKRRPVKLLWVQVFSKKSEALEAERMIKGWSRRKKLL